MARTNIKYGMGILSAFTVAIIVIAFAVTNALSLECPQGMISYWKLDEGSGNVTYDSVGTNHGTVYSGATWITGQVDGALGFDGIDDYVNCGQDSSLDVGTNATWASWICFAATPEGGPVIVSKDEGGGEHNKYIFDFIVGVPGYLRFHINGPPPYYPLHGDAIFSNAWTPEIEQWYHIALVKSDKDYAFYKNGQPFGTDSTALDVPEIINAPLEIGAVTSEPPEHKKYFNGRIDEIAIWNRALSAEEILQHYQNGLNGLGYVVVFSITNPNEGDVFCPDQNITFTAVTNPGGYESLIQWSGGENPATGTGATFTTSFSTSGEKTVTASCDESSVSRTITILSIGSTTATVVPTEEMFIVSSSPFPTDPVVQRIQTQIEEIAPFIVTDKNGIQRLLSAEARHAGVSVDTLVMGHKLVSLNNRIVKAAMGGEEIHLPASDFAFIEPFFQFQAQSGSHCGSFRNPTPCPPWVESGIYFPTENEIVQHLLSLGYHQTARYASLGGFGPDYTLVVPHPACGTGPFRTQAIIRQQGDCWTYSTQGPEPNPEFRSYTTRPHVWWIGYVAWWHRFYCN